MATSTGVVDSAFIYIMAFSFLLFFAIVFVMILFLFRYRRSRNPKPTDISGNTVLEILWVVLPTLLVLTMFFYGLTGFTFLRHPPADSMSVTVHSRQWAWLFQYANGITSTDLIAPLDRNVRLELVSDDVIHGFFVPAFRIKQDAVPGMKTQAWFRATETGSYDVLCTQYCGQRHSAMIAKLVVITPEEFDEWYKGEIVQVSGVTLPSTRPAGEDLLRQRGCLACHSTDGSPLVGPTFKGFFGSSMETVTNGKQRTVVADEAYIEMSIVDPAADIAKGFPNIMPSGKGIVTDDEIDEMIQLLKTLK
jgi:cytochrome c oxidase subunit 2